MKTKNLFHLAAILVSVIALTFASCSKENLDSGKADPTSLQQLTVDENNVDGVIDNAVSDVESTMTLNVNGLKSSAWRPCNGTIDSMAVVNDTITIFINYNGLSCNGTTNRSGKIEIKMKVGTHWSMPGATVIFKYIDFTVTRVATNKSITLNGTKTYVNVSGGTRWMVGTLLNSYVEKVSGSMLATFDNGVVRTWNVARQHTYTGTPGAFIMTVDGFGSADGYQNLVTWGTNRNSEQFYTQITQSVVCRQTCDWNAVSGIKVHQIPSDNKSATITFGYNSNNEPITGDECPTRYRVDWQKNNQSGTSYLPI